MSYRSANPWRRSGWFAVAALIIVVDQISKIHFNTGYQYGEMRAVIPGFFSFTLVYNPGAAFNFLGGAGGWQKHLFTGLAFAVSGWLGWNVVRGRFSLLMNCAASFIIGGALGNVVDRLLYGHVIDFILLYYHDWFYPAFNLADSFICLGAALMILDSLTNKR